MESRSDPLAYQVANLLILAKATVATAESCTGGLLAGALTDIAGSSAYFPGGIIAYDNRIKSSLLGVSPEIIAEQGAVSAAIALAMAHHVRTLLGAEIGLSVTGIAGPSGATPDKPVGTTFIACASGGWEEVREFYFSETRAGNRALSVRNALMMLKAHLENGYVGTTHAANESEVSGW